MSVSEETSDDDFLKNLKVYSYKDVEKEMAILYTLLNRGCEYEFIRENISNIFMREGHDIQCYLWVLTFQTRDIRGGKGERKLFFDLLKSILPMSPVKFTHNMLKLIPEYGCWRDVIQLLEDDWVTYELKQFLYKMVLDQFEIDYKNFLEKKHISFLAKWMPREKKKNHRLVKILANAVSGDEKKNKYNLMIYRKKCSEMNKYLETTEIAMCNKNFSSINPSKVPVLCFSKYRKSFLNSKNSIDQDRIKCAEKFKNYIDSKEYSLDKNIQFSLNENSFESLRTILDDPRYDMVRQAYNDAVFIYESPRKSDMTIDDFF